MAYDDAQVVPLYVDKLDGAEARRRRESSPVMFPTLIVDPPWHYTDRLMSGTTRHRTRGGANHYRVMTLDALRALRPQDVAAADSHIYLWTTNAFVGEALDLMRTWTHVQKTMLTWVKPQIGMGHYFRNNTEHVLFGASAASCPRCAATCPRRSSLPGPDTRRRRTRSTRSSSACRRDRTWSCSPVRGGRAGRLWATESTGGPSARSWKSWQPGDKRHGACPV